jgi:hypothetical protein
VVKHQKILPGINMVYDESEKEKKNKIRNKCSCLTMIEVSIFGIKIEVLKQPLTECWCPPVHISWPPRVRYLDSRHLPTYLRRSKLRSAISDRFNLKYTEKETKKFH